PRDPVEAPAAVVLLARLERVEMGLDELRLEDPPAEPARPWREVDREVHLPGRRGIELDEAGFHQAGAERVDRRLGARAVGERVEERQQRAGLVGALQRGRLEA